jgi:type VI protein secretion system component VasA
VPAVNLRELPLDSVPAGALTCEVNVTRALDAPSAGTDVYAVRKVQVDATEVPHLMLGRAVREPAPGGLRWHAERFPATAANPLGRVTLRLLDPALEAADLGGRVFHLTVDVTNRSLSPDVRGVRDYEEMSCNGIRATAVRLPTPVLHPKPDAGGGALTLATLNSLALGGRANAGRMLAGVLAAFALLDAECDDADPDEQDRQAFAKSLLSGLTEVGVEPDEDWDRGWVSGRHYRVRLSHAANRPGSGFLLGTVLESVLAGFAGWDAFVRTTVTTPTATHTFPAQIGEEDL